MDEKKTYLINIESNLKEYIDELVQAKKKLEDAKYAVDELKKGQFKSREEIELTNAKLRDAKKEVSDATKLVQLATLANKAQSGSYEQLYRQHQLMQTALKIEGGMMLQNTDGTYRMTDKYIKLSKEVDNAKRGLDQFGKGIHDNRLNVGNYSEALQGAIGKFSAMPGPIGRAASSGQSFISTIAKIGPLGAVIAGAIMAISLPFIAFFTKTEEGMHLLEQKVAGIKASINVLIGDISRLGESWVENMRKIDEEGGKSKGQKWADISNKFLTFLSHLTVGGPKVLAYVKDLNIRMTEAQITAEGYTKKEQELLDLETAMIVPRAEANKGIKEARLLFANTTKDIETRTAALQKSFDIENKTADKEIEHQRQVVANLKVINEEKKKVNMLTQKDDRALAEAEAKVINLEAESIGRQIRGQRQMYTALAAIRKDEFTLRLLETRGNDEETKKVLKDQLDFELKNTELTNTQKKILEIKYQEDILKIDKEGLDAFIKYWNLKDSIDEEKMKRDNKAGFEFQRMKVGVNVDALDQILNAEYGAMLASVEYTKMTDNEKLLADEQYTENKRQLSLLRIDQQVQEYDLIANITNSVSELFGKQTIAAKGLSVAQALISTYTAGVKAMAELPLGSGPVLRFLTLASVIAAGLVQVKNILAVKIPGGDSGGGSSISAPTSISTSAPAQRAFANPVGSTILTQPQLTQPQLNALPNQNLLTAQDIANALSNMPAPVVTVEDINAKTKSVNKVSVRATI